ncbi:hypothetical protein KRR26_23700 [Corallococcus sp. M34]|uniref:hypothetical protein n=1 Tax=Citreicoccus inhibens TaxID=2849499 RepID=UPI0011C45611|nr:hypothetical protein [Citreicoccus inhibens]MBU8898619.1 hypothetical protein [Citreicoccus inhibens]
MTPIDTVREAVYLVSIAGYTVTCDSDGLEVGAVKRNTDGSFNVVATSGFACGTNSKLTQHLLQVSGAGVFRGLENHTLERGNVHSDGCATNCHCTARRWTSNPRRGEVPRTRFCTR